MKIFKHKINLQKELTSVKNLSFVPTMGGLHKGHEYLISQSRKKGNKVLVSIYVNPKQFNSKNDYLSYPRNLKKDINILKKLKTDYLYAPKFNDLYKFKPKKKIFLHNFSKKLCGKYRKGHFNGVLNVVNRLIEIINPKYIFLGIKDFQQLYLIKKHILSNKISTKVIGCKTIRNKFGVAESSRNINLNKKDMKIASNVYQYLKNRHELVEPFCTENPMTCFVTGIANIKYNAMDHFSLLRWLPLVCLGITIGNVFYKNNERQFKLFDKIDSIKENPIIKGLEWFASLKLKVNI